MNKVKLDDIVSIRTGRLNANAAEDGGKYPFFTTAEKVSRINSYSYEGEVVLVAGNGDLNVKYYNGKFDAYQRTYILSNKNEEKLDMKYLYYFMSLYVERLRNEAIGGVIKYIKKSNLTEAKVPLPDLSTQKEIIRILEQTETIINDRKIQMQELDDLTQSIFYKMFGDPRVNSRKWVVDKISAVTESMVPARDKPKSFTGDIPWITIADLNYKGVTSYSRESLGLTESEILEVGRETIPKGSVIMSCVGNLGITSIAGQDLVINQQLHSYQCHHGKINNVFLNHLLPYYKEYMELQANSTTVLYMNKSKCNSIPIIIPPIELQEEFAVKVNEIEIIKKRMQASLDEMNTLFDALMQEAFTGELV